MPVKPPKTKEQSLNSGTTASFTGSIAKNTGVITVAKGQTYGELNQVLQLHDPKTKLKKGRFYEVEGCSMNLWHSRNNIVGELLEG